MQNSFNVTHPKAHRYNLTGWSNVIDLFS